ncbi:hypothetical protein A2T55_16340 [Brevibacterium linens]|uniref:Polysaccharide chain length determinant N-terminal domain-containing protein n=1 Tax=Brevibacterium linens TaxID=1703 RepID=A0A144MIJ0_BRELN|nr:hypothetical protein [Brevibacterium linens]AMT95084.1 hypothetical protein A2T55_16340 [Brevibacterium linens]
MKTVAALRRYWVLATLVFVIIAVATALFAAFAPRTYTATTILVLVPEAETNPSGDLVQLAVPTYAELANAPSVMNDMAEEMGEDPKKLSSSVKGEVAPATNTVVVSVRWGDPDRAAELANGVTEELEELSGKDPLLTAYVASPAEPPFEPSFPPLGITMVIGGIIAVVAAPVAARIRWAVHES